MKSTLYLRVQLCSTDYALIRTSIYNVSAILLSDLLQMSVFVHGNFEPNPLFTPQWQILISYQLIHFYVAFMFLPLKPD